MKYPQTICTAILAAISTTAVAQVASHASTLNTSVPAAAPAQVSLEQPVARGNGTVLTQRDLLREMYTIFPYARQHSGFPKSQEAQIRKGALDMIVFEELVYQEALRRKMPISEQTTSSGLKAYKQQFNSEEQYKAYLADECHGSEKILRQRVK